MWHTPEDVRASALDGKTPDILTLVHGSVPCPRATVKRPNTVMPSAAPTCSAMATAARASRPLCSRATISMAKVEKVVSPPRKPVIMASRHSGARLGCR